jgi:hypothetical protein
MNLPEIIGQIKKHGANVLPPKEGAQGVVLMTFSELEKFVADLTSEFDKKLAEAHAAHAESVTRLIYDALD